MERNGHSSIAPWWRRVDGVPPWWPWQHAQDSQDAPVIDLAEPIDLRPSILIVDDEMDVRDWLRVTLSVKGWQIREADSGEAALRMVESEPPDVIVVDQNMAGMTGLGCARRLRARGFESPIILVSALIAPAEIEEAAGLRVLTVSKVHSSLLLATIDLLREPVIDLAEENEEHELESFS